MSVYRLTRTPRNGLLWRVSGKLILSYILVGAVPILLLVTFSLLAFLLIFFDVGSYLVQSRMTAMAEQANTMARTTLYEVERSKEPRDEILARRQNAIATRYADVSIRVVPAAEMPPWLKSPSFSGLVMAGGRFVVRAASVQGTGRGSHRGASSTFRSISRRLTGRSVLRASFSGRIRRRSRSQHGDIHHPYELGHRRIDQNGAADRSRFADAVPLYQRSTAR